MGSRSLHLKKHRNISVGTAVVLLAACALAGMLTGCIGGDGGYTNQWLFPDDVSSVYVEMFDSLSFRRGYEYQLTDAVAKRIEAQTPYKIVSDRDLADTVLSGKITSIGSGTLAVDRETGRDLENETYVNVELSWQNLRTGEVLINNETVVATASYSQFLDQDFDYAAGVAVNRAAKRIVELMQVKW